MRLRGHLVALVLAALVPVLGFAALVIRENTRLQLVATERGMRETAHAVARTVDKELETAVLLVGADRVRAAGRPAAGARRGIRRAPGEAGAPRRAARGHRGGRGRVLKRVKSPLAVV
jgi:hypothetical protein